MSDFFHEGADQWRSEAWQVIRDCPNLDWLILTKRPEFVPERLPQDWNDGYHKGDHPRIRLTENELDAQMLAIFDTLRVEDAEFRDLFREQLRQATNWEFGQASKEDGNLKNRHTEVVRLQQQLLNLRLLEEIDADTYAEKARELRDGRYRTLTRSPKATRSLLPAPRSSISLLVSAWLVFLDESD